MSEEVSVDVTEAAGATPAAESTDAGNTAKPESESAPQAQDDQPDSETKPDKPKGGFQQRIDKLTRDRIAAQQRAQDLEQRLAQYEQQRQTATKPSDDGPKEADYTDWNQFIDAKAEYKANQAVEKAFSARRQAETQQSQREQQQTNVREFIVRAEALSSEVPDFSEAAGEIQMGTPAGQALLQSEHGAAVAYFLGRNPAELMRVEAIRDPVRAAVEIGRLEAKAQQFVQSRSKSKAPPQSQPLATGGKIGGGLTAEMPMADFARKLRELRNR